MALRLDAAGATRVLGDWPLRPGEKLMPGGPWLRAQPPDGSTTGPRFVRPGSVEFSSHTQPDALWLSFFRPAGGAAPVAVSAFAVEVCGSGQNLADKRSRYAPAHAALLIEVGTQWLLQEVDVQGGGSKPRWKLVKAFKKRPKRVLRLPVRSLRVLFALPNDKRLKQHESTLYDKLKGTLALEAHEYLARHSSLSPTNPKLRKLIRRMLSPHTL